MTVLCIFLVQIVTVVIATGLVLRIVRRHHNSIGVLTVGIDGALFSAADTAGPQTNVVEDRVYIRRHCDVVSPRAGPCLLRHSKPSSLLMCDVAYGYHRRPFFMNRIFEVFIYFYNTTNGASAVAAANY